MMVILAALLLTAPVPADEDPCHPNEPNYSAIFSSTAPPGRFELVEEGSDIEVEPGWRLDDVEVATVNGEKFVGLLLRQGDAAETELVEVAGAQAFADLVETKLRAGECLSGFEAWRVEGTEHFAGVFGAECASQLFYVGLDLATFSKRLAMLETSHRLIDFETTVAAGEPELSESTFSALFRPLAAENADREVHTLLDASWKTLHGHAHFLRKSGFRLVDLDIEMVMPTVGIHGPSEKSAGAAGGERPTATRSLTITSKPSRHDCPIEPEPVESARFSAVWERSGDTDWLAVDYHLGQLECAAETLPGGCGVSGLDPESGEALCGKEDWDPPQDQTPLHLLSIESHTPLVLACSGWHGSPLHDSGTAGPP